MRFPGLLDAPKERGSAAIEAVFSIVVLIFMMLGVVEIAFSLYARNVVAASAHEGARAAIERGRSAAEAAAIATETVRRSAGGLVDELGVDVGSQLVEGRSVVNVVVSGRVKTFGPIPFPMHIRTEASAVEETEVP